jgi:hypothetical protein
MAGPAVAAPSSKAGASAKIEYNRDVRPILSDNCFLCHGPDKNARKAKLRLDIREDAIAKKAFVPGQPDESELVKRIFTRDPDDLMPPPDSHKHLTTEQKETLRRWIAEGAEYQPHWAYINPTRPEVPSVKNIRWVRNPIDAFILRRLEEHGLTPSPEADRRTLLRRLSLDLIGLPPTPEEIAAFVADKSSAAYEKQVERLLASPHFGERMAVPWLDTVRFSDTVGYHGDQNQRIFPYRDYVIASFNKNKPFDLFTIEQVAGDLMPNPTIEQRVATGFNRLNMMTREGGAQPKEYLAKYAADRVRTVATTWLGSTMGCAECHDHKFDPFTMRDFYSMEAFFADIQQWGVYSDYKYTPNPDLKGWSNDHPFPPELEVESEYLRRRAQRLHAQMRRHLATTHATLETNAVARASFESWIRSSRDLLAQHPDGWQTPEVILPQPAAPTVSSNAPASAEKGSLAAPAQVVGAPGDVITASERVSGEDAGHDSRTQGRSSSETKPPAPPALTLEANGAVRVALSRKKDEERIELRLPPGRLAALRLERLSGEHDEELDPGAQARGIRLSAVLKREGKETKVVFYRADADYKEPRFDNGEELIGILQGWRPSDQHARETQTAVWLPEPPLEATDGDRLVVTLKSTGPLTVRFAASPFAAEDPVQAGANGAFRAALMAAGILPAEEGIALPAGTVSSISSASPGRASAPPRETPDATAGGTAGAPDPLLLAERYLLSAQWDKDAFAQFKKLQADLLECRNGRVYTMVTESWTPITMRILPRGNWQNESGEIVQPAPPHFLPQPANESGHRLTRLDLARWLVSRDNPLTARVTMNRLWKQFFGTGISAVLDDVGAQGEWPVHAELLDWLAVEFMEPANAVDRRSESGVESERSTIEAPPRNSQHKTLSTPWDIKHMVRLIVTSAAYRQGSNLRPDLKDIDPQNRWLASQNPRRLEAEFVRDNALFVAGLLNLEIGGPSGHPYQPAGYYANIQFPDRDYIAETDDRQYRRGVYMHWQRTFLHPMLANFDAPSREECTANRVVSNTPQQALTLLNDPTFVEASRAFAANLLAATRASDQTRVGTAFQRALGRAPEPKELASLTHFLAEQRMHYTANADEATKLLRIGLRPTPSGCDEAELATWTQVCRVVLNLHESVTRY